MTIYKIYTEVETNIHNYQDLYYTMELYRFKPDGYKYYALKPTAKYPLQTDGKTQLHPSLDITDKEQTNFIMSVMLYRKVGVEFIPLLTNPVTNISPLKGFTSKAPLWGRSRNTICYLETTQPTQRAKEDSINTYQLKISCQQRIFIAKQHPIGDPLDPFTKAKVEEELKIRMTRPVPDPVKFDPKITWEENQKRKELYDDRERIRFYPWQDRSMLCGPAAFFYCVQKDRPDLYQQVIKELWESGKTKIGSLVIEPSNGTKHPDKFFYKKTANPRLPVIDWITLASLRDTESYFISIDKPTGPLVDFSSATLAGTLERWFNRVGAETIFDNIVYRRHSNIEEVCQLNTYINSDYHVLSLISAAMLKGGAEAFLGMKFKTHWIVWEDKLRLLDGSEITTKTNLSEKVKLTLFSWGKVTQQLKINLTLEQFLEHTYGGMVFSKIP